MKVLAIAALAALATSSAAAQTAPTPPAAIAANCYLCHGTEGKSRSTIPQLHGLKADYIATSLLQFRTDQRPASIMNRIAKGYSEEQIRAVADYLGNLK